MDARTSDDPDRLQLSTDFIKKYINYAKQKIKPTLSDGAAKKIQARPRRISDELSVGSSFISGPIQTATPAASDLSE